MPAPLRPAPPVLDSMASDEFVLRPAEDTGPVPAPDAQAVDLDLGHS